MFQLRYRPPFPGGPQVTTPYNGSGNNKGYLTTVTYYLYAQAATSGAIVLPGLTLKEVLTTTSNPLGAQFIPPDQSPLTGTSNSAGMLWDFLYAYVPGGLPSNFSASRSQSLTGNGFPITPAQQQSYTPTYGTVASTLLQVQN